VAGAAISGKVHGGQQPIVGAHVYLLAANGATYGSASASLLASSATGYADSLGAYVLTDATGFFSLDSVANGTTTYDYTCPTAATQVYLYAIGGNPGAGASSSPGLLAALGSCGALSSATNVIVNEVTTVAAAYALSGFAVDATHISGNNNTLSQTGLQNAFSSAANLVNLATGTALATTPAGNGTVPQAEINTLANILASCINSNGAVTGPASPTACYTLFNNAMSGGSTGTVPTDTATAAINIAHHPGQNIAALYGAATPSSPFSPVLSTHPNDFTIALSFTGGGLYEPGAVAIDAEGNIWSTNSNNVNINNVSKLSPVGAPLSPSTGYVGIGKDPLGIAINGLGFVWIANGASDSVSELEYDGTTDGIPISGGGLSNPAYVAVDGFGIPWVANETGGKVTQITQPYAYGYNDLNTQNRSFFIAVDSSNTVWTSGSEDGMTSIISLNVYQGSPYTVSQYAVAGGDGPLAIDAQGHVWIAGALGSTTELSSAGVPSSGSPFLGGGQCLYCSNGIAVDGAGNIWITNGDFEPPYSVGVTELSNAGAAVSPSTGFRTSLLSYPIGIAVDGSGNVWVADDGGLDMIEFVGAGVPVVTPLAAGVANHTLGTRP
jgi:hypothetical protein